MATKFTTEQRYELITRGLAEVNEGDSLKAILEEGRSPRGMWACAPTGRPHVGYAVPMVKLAEFMMAGVDVNLLVVDIYAYLVNYKHPLNQVQHRARIYKFVLSAVLEAIGIPVERLTIQQETSFLFTKEKMLDLLKMTTILKQSDCRATGEESARSAMLSPLLTAGLQSLDEEFLQADFEFGGLDQRGIFDLSHKLLPQMGYKKRAHLMNPMLPGISGGKMSASIPDSKIDCLDSPETVIRKISNVNIDEVEVTKNGILGMVRLVLMPISRLRLERIQGLPGREVMFDRPPFCNPDAPEGTLFSVGERHYKSYEEVERDFIEKKLDNEALKSAVAGSINELLSHVRKSYEANEEWQAEEKLAYPDGEETKLNELSWDVNFCYPVRELSNDRLKLTPFNPTIHAGSYFNHTLSCPEVYKHMSMGPFITAGDFISNFFDTVVHPNPAMSLYAIIDKTQPACEDPQGALTGVISFMDTSVTDQSTEIGYVITFPMFQRTHVTTNAVGLLLQYALDAPADGGLGLRRVAWKTSSANTGSMRTAERIGFMKEGVLRWDRVFKGGKDKGKDGNGKALSEGADDIGRDTVVYSIVWDDWREGGVRERVLAAMDRRS